MSVVITAFEASGSYVYDTALAVPDPAGEENSSNPLVLGPYAFATRTEILAAPEPYTTQVRAVFEHPVGVFTGDTDVTNTYNEAATRYLGEALYPFDYTTYPDNMPYAPEHGEVQPYYHFYQLGTVTGPYTFYLVPGYTIWIPPGVTVPSGRWFHHHTVHMAPVIQSQRVYVAYDWNGASYTYEIMWTRTTQLTLQSTFLKNGIATEETPPLLRYGSNLAENSPHGNLYHNESSEYYIYMYLGSLEEEQVRHRIISSAAHDLARPIWVYYAEDNAVRCRNYQGMQHPDLIADGEVTGLATIQHEGAVYAVWSTDGGLWFAICNTIEWSAHMKIADGLVAPCVAILRPSNDLIVAAIDPSTRLLQLIHVVWTPNGYWAREPVNTSWLADSTGGIVIDERGVINLILSVDNDEVFIVSFTLDGEGRPYTWNES